MQKVLWLTAILFIIAPNLMALDRSARETRSMARKGISASSLEEACSSVQEIGDNGLFKWKASDHINPADPRAAGPSLICHSNNKRCVQWPARLVNCDGSEVLRGALYRYGTWIFNGADRGYTFRGRSAAIKKRARALGCQNVYIQVTKQSSSSIPACYSVDIDQERNGAAY